MTSESHTIGIKIANSIVTAYWSYVWPRLDMPKDLDLSQFPHSVAMPRTIDMTEIENWCLSHVGTLDQSWTYRDSREILFANQEDAVQFSLIMDSLL